MSELSYSSGCVGCPRLDGIEREIEAIDRHKSTLTELAVDDDVPFLLNYALREDLGVPEDIASEAIKDGMGGLRKKIADDLNDIDKKRDSLVLDANALTVDCLGKLRMRARTKAGRMVTVTVCGSNAVPRSQQHESAYVERTEPS